ncbi:TPA: hypothetical protein ACIAVT_004329, partial [Salmonella enterica subsp. enterica serovar Virchow]
SNPLRWIVRIFSDFLQHSGEIGKTLAEMCIERHPSQDHNDDHQADSRLPSFYPHKGMSNEQFQITYPYPHSVW